MYQNIRKLKEQPETAAAGNIWTSEEETKLIEALKDNKNIKDIAKEHKRTSGGIKSRIKELAVRMIETDGSSIDEVCDIFKMTPYEIQAAQTQKRRIATKAETELDVLKDIRKLLIRIEEKINIKA